MPPQPDGGWMLSRVESVYMKRMVRLFILACFLGMIITAYPVFSQTSATDAVQTEQIRVLDLRLIEQSRLVQEMSGQMKWLQGGIAGIYGFLGVIGIFNLKVNGKR
jgi:hypothetical protein